MLSLLRADAGGVARLALATGFLVLLFSSGGRFALSLMLHPMVDDLGWSRTTLSSVVTVFMVLSALALPLTGRLVDRLGPSTVLAAGIGLSGLGLALMGLIDAPWQAFVLYGVLFALGNAATSITPVGVMLSRWYPDRAGMANSIAISGMGVGQLLIVSVLAAQLGALGWRGAYVALGIATVVCVLPLVVMGGRRQAEALRAAPADGARARNGESAGRTAHLGPAGAATSLGELATDRRLWTLGIVYVLCGYQDFLVATHVVAFALDEGIGTLLAGNLLAFMGLFGLVGVLVTGALNDRYGPRLPTAICFVMRVVLFALVLASRHPGAIAAMALGYGFTFWITAPLTVIFARALAGLTLLGTLTGTITMVHHIAGGVGALVGAGVFDLSGSYDGAFWSLLVTSAVALALVRWLPGGEAAMPASARA